MDLPDRAVLRRYRLVIMLAACGLLIGLSLRAALWFLHGRPAGVTGAALVPVVAGGLANDAVVTCYLLAPLALYSALLPDRAWATRFNRRLLLTGSWLTVCGLAFLAVVEAYFFQEFDSRFNLVAFDYLAYPTEVVGDVWQEYPVLRAALGAAAVATLAVLWIAPRLAEPSAGRTRFAGRAVPLTLHAAAVALAAQFWPTGLLSWSDNRVANELVQNGISSFFRAAITSEIDFRANYRVNDSRENFILVEHDLERGGGVFTRLADGRLDRSFPARPGGLGRLNVVLVSSESFGAEFSRLHGSDRDLTPNFDAFARRSLWFSNAYASGTRTVRGLEAVASSIPPIPTVSILRHPGGEHIATWGAVMHSLGYRVSFQYGGYGYFDNMNHFFGSNGFEVRDRRDIRSVRYENMWGVSDEDLFDDALAYLDRVHAGGRPFFSIIMTTSNHKPFTFRPGLERHGIPASGGGRAAGVRYADYALGEFLRKAERHAWFDDTLFVVAADHGARVYGAEQIPLRSYEIPVMFYAPKHLPPRRVDALTTQVDIAPTVLGLLGLRYEAPFFGQDVLSTPAAGHVAFFNHNHDVAIYRDGTLVVFGLRKSVRTWHYDPATGRLSPAPPDPGLERLGIAYFQTASELFASHRYGPSTDPVAAAGRSRLH